jgi:hypothetical protein
LELLTAGGSRLADSRKPLLSHPLFPIALEDGSSIESLAAAGAFIGELALELRSTPRWKAADCAIRKAAALGDEWSLVDARNAIAFGLKKDALLATTCPLALWTDGGKILKPNQYTWRLSSKYFAWTPRSLFSAAYLIDKQRLQRRLSELRARFPDEETCAGFLISHRWPDGPRCPRCSNVQLYHLVYNPFHWQCEKCERKTYRFSVKVGTLFENSNKTLFEWFSVISLISADEFSYPQIRAAIKLGSYKTAWGMATLMKTAMRERGVWPLWRRPSAVAIALRQTGRLSLKERAYGALDEIAQGEQRASSVRSADDPVPAVQNDWMSRLFQELTPKDVRLIP